MDESKRKGKQTITNTDYTEDIISQVLAGNQRLISHGASQYRGGSVSACGIAALNCARIILTAEQDGLKDEDLLNFVLDPSTAEEITSICNRWSSTFHLEVEDISRVPLFSNSLSLVGTKFGKPCFNEFKSLLRALKKRSPHATSCVVITRPPEIITCVKIATSITDIFLIFDSHIRPSHPDGAGFTFSTSIDTTARNLTDLLAVDSHLLAGSGMQWQIQLLSNYSGHMFVANSNKPGAEEVTETMLESSLTILALRGEVTNLKDQNTSLMEDNRRLETELENLKTKNRQVQEQLEAMLWSGPSQEPGDSRHRTRNHSGSTASFSRVHNELQSGTSSSTRAQALVYYSGDPCPPSTSKSTRSHSQTNTNHLDPLPRENSGITLANQVRHIWGDYPHPDAAKALEIQHKFEEEDRRLAEERTELLAQSVQAVFSCAVCFEDYSKEYVARIVGCEHTFCRDCLRGYILSKLSEHRYPILCPVCITGKGPKEPGVVTNSLVQDIGIPENNYKILEELQVSAFSVLLHCRKCKRSVFVDRTEYQESKLIACPLPECLFAWCKACQQEITVGGPQHSCDGSSELEHLMKMRGWKHCPGCTTPIQKDSGCNHMTCMSPGCNTHFCYICGDLIIKSALGQEIRAAISAHYRQCRLFEDVA